MEENPNSELPVFQFFNLPIFPFSGGPLISHWRRIGAAKCLVITSAKPITALPSRIV